MNSKRVIRMGLVDMQVCVHKNVTDVEVEAFANEQNPTGISSRWKVKQDGNPTLNGCPSRVQCEEVDCNCHIMLEC